MKVSEEIIKSYIDSKLMNLGEYNSVLHTLINHDFKNNFWKDTFGILERISFYDLILDYNEGSIDIIYNCDEIVVNSEVKLEIYYYLLELFNFFKDNNVNYNEKQTNRS